MEAFLTRLDERLQRLTERVEELAEDLRVKWFMLDAGQKQALMLAALYAGYTLLDVMGAVAKTRLGGKT